MKAFQLESHAAVSAFVNHPLLVLVVFLLYFNSAQAQLAETVLHTFSGGTDGADPVADLLYDSNSGFFYGTTNMGGGPGACAKGCGTVFTVNSGGSGYNILHSFVGPEGANPQAGLIRDGSGNFYGTTANGGAKKMGTIFELSPIGGGLYSETVLFSFSGKNGEHPLSRLIFDGSGNLYGTTEAGGPHGDGVVFEFTSGTERVLYSFSGGDGSHPRAGLKLDASGNLWGTTSLGGSSNLGVVFALTSSAGVWSPSFIYSFTGSNGANPYGTVIFDASGNAYGTTKNGGAACAVAAAGCGVVYELQPGPGGYTGSVIYAFSGGGDGALPVDALTITVDVSGFRYLYGTASEGGSTAKGCPKTGCGTAFELCSSGSSCGGAPPWSEYTLYDFTGKVGGRTPEAGILNFLPPPTEWSSFDVRGQGGRGQCTSGCGGTTSASGTPSSEKSNAGTTGYGTVFVLN